MHNVAMNILIHVSGGHMHSPLCISMYRIAASYGVYFFTFLGTVKQFSKVVM